MVVGHSMVCRSSGLPGYSGRSHQDLYIAINVVYRRINALFRYLGELCVHHRNDDCESDKSLDWIT